LHSVLTAGDLPAEIDDWWADFARSLRRRNRSDATAQIYRESLDRFWTWAAEVGIDPDPAAVTTADVNAFTDKLVASGALGSHPSKTSGTKTEPRSYAYAQCSERSAWSACPLTAVLGS
jgi:site-specific recombinase XerD